MQMHWIQVRRPLESRITIRTVEEAQLALETDIRKYVLVAVVEADIRTMSETKRVVEAVAEIKSVAEAEVVKNQRCL